MNSLSRTLTALITAGSLAACTTSNPLQSYETPLNKESRAVRSVETDLGVSIGDNGAAITDKDTAQYVIGCSSMQSFDAEQPGKPSLENRPLGQATMYLEKEVKRSERHVKPIPHKSYRSVDSVVTNGAEERIVTECTVHRLYE